MAGKSTTGSKPKRGERPPAASWTDLTWDDLHGWAGGRTVERGRSYQRGGRVTGLGISRDGRLLATVLGTESYTTTASLTGTRARPALESACSCPVGYRCKHAVAVVAAYLDAVAGGRDVPIAAEDDPRWDDAVADSWDEDDDDEDGDSSWGDFEDDAPPRPPKARRRGDAAGAVAESAVEQHVRSKSQAELADLVLSLAGRFPEIDREFRERIALQSGDVDRLLAEARREIRRVTSEPAWRNHWDDEGHIPDYGPIRHRFERLLELGHADAVVSLGREFLEHGIRQVGESHDEGETASAFSECLPVVFQAVARSGLAGPDRIRFAIDAILSDDYDTIGEAADPVLEASYPADDWSAVADALAGRLKAMAGRSDSGSDRFADSYRRDRVTDWVADALRHAGREDELEALYESEARATWSYERLVAFLLERKRYDDAERRAREGIAATVETYPGIAGHLADQLLELARSRRRWGVVAAHLAHEFFEHPTPSGFDELVKAARKAKVEGPAREAALRYLETGEMPYRVAPSKPPPTPPGRGRPKSPALKRAEAARKAPPASAAGPPRMEVAPSWPLSVPDELVPMIACKRAYDPGPRPHLDVLLLMAIAAKRLDEVLRWYDRMRADRKGQGHLGPFAGSYADRVAEAVADEHPDRAIAIYREALETQLPRAEASAYDASAGYLRKLRPIYGTLGRSAEWDGLLATIRERYRNRPRFMERLDRLDGRPIVESSRSRRG